MKLLDLFRNKIELRPAPDFTANDRSDCGYTEAEMSEAPEVTFEDEESFWDGSEAEIEPPEGPVGAGGGSVIDDRMIAELRQYGLKVRTVSGWRTRGRDGTFAPRGIMPHHTASNKASGPRPALGIVTHGRSDLPGPLCNFHLGRDAVVTVVAAGRANHAGEGGPTKGIPEDSANAYTAGVEAENDGVGEKWPDKQREAYVILCAVFLRRVRRSEYMTIAHKEWTKRKIDPAGINMDNFRNRVQNHIRDQKRNERRIRRRRR